MSTFLQVEKSLSSVIKQGQLVEIMSKRSLPTWYITMVQCLKCNAGVDHDSVPISKKVLWNSLLSNSIEKSFTLDKSFNIPLTVSPDDCQTVNSYWIAKITSSCGPLLR